LRAACRLGARVALVGIGALIGARFARMTVKTLLGHVNCGAGSFAIAIIIPLILSR